MHSPPCGRTGSVELGELAGSNRCGCRRSCWFRCRRGRWNGRGRGTGARGRQSGLVEGPTPVRIGAGYNFALERILTGLSAYAGGHRSSGTSPKHRRRLTLDKSSSTRSQPGRCSPSRYRPNFSPGRRPLSRLVQLSSGRSSRVRHRRVGAVPAVSSFRQAVGGTLLV